MKARSIKMLAVCMLFISFAIQAYSQTIDATKDDMKKRSKVEKTKVPKDVTVTFYSEYPGATLDNWYSYPTFDYAADWYGYYPYTYSANPQNYAVEFNKDGMTYTVIYSSAGKKVATHRVMRSALPTAITAALSKSMYKTWNMGKDKEEIFKDSDADKTKIYKIDVYTGKQKHMLYYQADGILIKDRKVS